VTAAFGVNGLCFAAWLSRTPAVRDALALSPAGLGLLLLCLSGGACLGLPLAGPLVQRYGTARIVLGGAMLTAVGLTGLAVGIGTRQREPAAVGLLLTGLGMSSWDVSMNVAGAEVERGLGRSLMPRLHAAFSLGTVAGAGVGAFTAAYGIPVPIPILGAVALAPVTMAVAVRGFPAHDATTDDSRSDERPDTRPDGRADPDTRSDGRAEPDGRAAPDVSSAWREPRTLAIGLLTLCFAFTEGTANDWLAVALVDGHHSSEVLGAIGYGVFLAAMTVTRVTGGAALDRFGRVAVLRLTAGFALLGLLLVIIGPGPGWALAGAALWGVGAALGFPVGMSAASDDPTRAAARVGVVSAVAYTAFLGGPPLIGFLAERVGILWSLLVVLVALLVGLFVSRAAEVPGPAGAPGTPAGRRRRRR
jgi:MFS family permease